jgi:hypothetical protein
MCQQQKRDVTMTALFQPAKVARTAEEAAFQNPVLEIHANSLLDYFEKRTILAMRNADIKTMEKLYATDHEFHKKIYRSSLEREQGEATAQKIMKEHIGAMFAFLK